jgi:hypothetical protein
MGRAPLRIAALSVILKEPLRRRLPGTKAWRRVKNLAEAGKGPEQPTGPVPCIVDPSFRARVSVRAWFRAALHSG